MQITNSCMANKINLKKKGMIIVLKKVHIYNTCTSFCDLNPLQLQALTLLAVAAAQDALENGRKSRNPKNFAITRRERTTLKYLFASFTVDWTFSWI